MHFAQRLFRAQNFHPQKDIFTMQFTPTSQPTIPLKSTTLCNMPIPQLNSLLTKCLSHTDVFKQLSNYMYNSYNILNRIYISSKSLAIFSFIACIIKSFTLL